MNIRLSGNFIRFRVSQREFSKLQQGQPLKEQTHVPPDHDIRYEVCIRPETSAIEWREGVIRLFLTPTEIDQFSSQPAKKDMAILFNVPLQKNESLHVSFEIDLFHRRGR